MLKYVFIALVAVWGFFVGIGSSYCHAQTTYLDSKGQPLFYASPMGGGTVLYIGRDGKPLGYAIQQQAPAPIVPILPMPQLVFPLVSPSPRTVDVSPLPSLPQLPRLGD